MTAIEHLQFIKAPPDQVFAALSTEQGLAEVWTNELAVSQQIGDILSFQFGSDDLTKMRLVEFEPGRRIVWTCIESDPEWVGTTITMDIEERKGNTAITLIHSGWREVTTFYRMCNYNWAIFLYSLQLYVEEGSGLNYQKRFS